MDSDEKRLKEIDNELKKVQKDFADFHSYKDEKTGKHWFPPGKYINYEKLVDREHELLKERKSIMERRKSA